MSAYHALKRALREARNVPTHLTAHELRAIPDSSELPNPWMTWCLFALLRHASRQRWATKIIRERLRVDPLRLARSGVAGLPEGVPAAGIVPGLLRWAFAFYGRGCCLTDRIRGGEIYLDFYDADGEVIHRFWFTEYLESFRQLNPVEKRLIELHPDQVTLSLAILDLVEARLVTIALDSPLHVIIPRKTRCLEGDVRRICQAWRAPEKRLWVAAQLGDWMAARDAAEATGDASLVEVTEQRARECGERRMTRLKPMLDAGDATSDLTLQALAALGPSEELSAYLQGALLNPWAPTTLVAVKVIAWGTDPSWSEALEPVFLRIDRDEELRRSSIWLTCLEYLLRSGCRMQAVVDALPRAAEDLAGVATLLALAYAPQHALPLLRRCLRSADPSNRTMVASLVTCIGGPWARQEIAAAMAESDRMDDRVKCRAAPSESIDLEACRAIKDRESEDPLGQGTGENNTLPSMNLEGLPDLICYYMDQLHDRIMRCRIQTYPPIFVDRALPPAEGRP